VDITYKQRLELNALCRAYAQRQWGGFSNVDVTSRWHVKHDERPSASNLLTIIDDGETGYGDTDICDYTPLLSLKRVEDHPSGCARLALYIYGQGELLDCWIGTVNDDGSVSAVGF
jgi:hypothetical protein